MLNNDLPSIASEPQILSPKWDLAKPIPQKEVEIEPTPPVTPKETEDKEDDHKDTQSESDHSTVPSIEEMMIVTIEDGKRNESNQEINRDLEEIQQESSSIKDSGTIF